MNYNDQIFYLLPVTIQNAEYSYTHKYTWWASSIDMEDFFVELGPFRVVEKRWALM